MCVAQRPAEPAGELWVHPLEYAGSTVQDKVAAIQQQMKEVGATLLLTSLLDEVAWLLNVVSPGRKRRCIVYRTVLTAKECSRVPLCAACWTKWPGC